MFLLETQAEAEYLFENVEKGNVRRDVSIIYRKARDVRNKWLPTPTPKPLKYIPRKEKWLAGPPTVKTQIFSA